MRKPFLVLALVAFAAGCSVLPKREPIRIFSPSRSAVTLPADVPQARFSLLVDEPTANDMLDSERINVRPDAGSVQVYEGASWSDPAPKLLQTALVHAFEDSGKILSVARPGGGVHGGYHLLTDVRAFEAVYGGSGPQAVLDVQAKLVDSRDGLVIATRNFRESEPAASEDVDVVVQAFSRALDRESAAIVAWTLTEGVRHDAQHGAGAKH
jgi:cholesterol transport system auxiliary component